MKSTTYAACSDVTPTRSTVECVGTYDECRSHTEDHGDDTWQILRVDGQEPSVGARVPTEPNVRVFG